jgi:hypothetical protein
MYYLREKTAKEIRKKTRAESRVAKVQEAAPETPTAETETE